MMPPSSLPFTDAGSTFKFSGSSGHRKPWASVSPATANTSNKHHALFAYNMESTSYDVSGILARERSTSVNYVTERSGGGTKRSTGP